MFMKAKNPEKDILNPISLETPVRFWMFTGFLALGFLWALTAWGWQIYNGMGVTGLGRPVFWGVYIINFVYFIGITHAGTLISSVLRITDTPWRRPFTRAAEAVTVFSLPFGAACVIVDLGRPDRLLNVLKYPHFSSPILWDVLCITTYLITSCMYFYMALIPDIALCRDRLTRSPEWQRKIYGWLSLGWMGSASQWKTLNRIMGGMSIFLFALVVSVHTNVSFVFAMTTKPGWHTTILAPYFVLGAVYCGVAMVIILTAAVRKIYHLEDYLTESHFNSMGKFLLALCCFWFYFTFIEFLSSFYGHITSDLSVFNAKFFGQYSVVFWIMFACCFPIPLAMLCSRRWRSVRTIVIASVIINIGMWLERFTVIVPSGARPYLSWGPASYWPSWVEWSVTFGWFCGFFLLFTLFARFFPILTVWEIKEGLEEDEDKERGREQAPVPS